MLYLLDTNVLIELRRKNPVVIANMKQRPPTSLCYSVITLGEIQKGVVQHPPDHGLMMWAQWRQLLAPFSCLDFTAEAALIWGRLLHETRKQQLGPRDLLIAATAFSNGMTVITHNTREFQRVDGLMVEDWQI